MLKESKSMAFLYQGLRKLSGQNLICPFYHAVTDYPPPHLKHLYHVKSVKSFKQDLAFFLKHYDPISLEDLFSYIKTKKKRKRPFFFLSFDDGLREIKEVVAPILYTQGIPATFFINPAFVDNAGLMFRYKASLLKDIYLQHKPRFKEIVEGVYKKHAYDYADSEKAIVDLDFDQRKALEELAEKMEIDFSAYLKTRKPYLNYDEIKALSDKGFGIGGHGNDHPYFARIPFNEQIRQAKESVQYVQDHFSQSIRAFAFPFTDYGVSKAFFNHVYGGETPVLDLSFGTAGMKKDVSLYHFHRIPLEDHLRGAAMELIWQYLYYLMKAPLGKNRIHRK